MSPCKYSVLEFLAPLSSTSDQYVCVPDSWIFYRDSNPHTRQRVAFQYPDGDKVEVMSAVIRNTTCSNTWGMCVATLIHTADTFEDAIRFIQNLAVLPRTTAAPSRSTSWPPPELPASAIPTIPSFLYTSTPEHSSRKPTNFGTFTTPRKRPISSTVQPEMHTTSSTPTARTFQRNSLPDTHIQSTSDPRPHARPDLAKRTRLSKTTSQVLQPDNDNVKHRLSKSQSDAKNLVRNENKTSSSKGKRTAVREAPQSDDQFRNFQEQAELYFLTQFKALHKKMQSDKNYDICKISQEINSLQKNYGTWLRLNSSHSTLSESREDSGNETHNVGEVTNSTAPRRRNDFPLPPEYNPTDSRWTLRYYQKDPAELIELQPSSGVFVNAAKLVECQRRSHDARVFAGNLMMEVFSDNALKVCSVTTKRRPGLDHKAINVMLDYVEQHRKNRGWEPIDLKSIYSSMNSKLYYIRNKKTK